MGACCSKKGSRKDDGYQQRKQNHYANDQGSQGQMVRQQQDELEHYNKQKSKQQKYTKPTGKGVAIGGTINGNTTDNQTLMADAAEKRAQQTQMRGISQQGQLDMQFKVQKQLDFERYQKERQGEPPRQDVLIFVYDSGIE